MTSVQESYPQEQSEAYNNTQQILDSVCTRRGFLFRACKAGTLIIGSAAFAGCDSKKQPQVQPVHNVGQRPETASEMPEESFLKQAGESLLDLHTESNGGWKYESAIQPLHNQTDRDVGNASVGMGFLALAEKYPDDKRWLDAAQKTANWLVAASKTDEQGGRFWNDYVDDGDVSPSTYTSFDDGAIGIGDYLWQLYEKTNDPELKTIALKTVEWTFSQAENVGQKEDVYRWQYDKTDGISPYYMGMGQGAVGLIHTFATYYERTYDTDPVFAETCKKYIDGALRYLDQVRATLGQHLGDSSYAKAMPETGPITQDSNQDGNTAINSGYLSGAAGGAFMYLKLFQVFGDMQYKAKADELFSWLEDTNIGLLDDFGDGTVAWKLMRDPQAKDTATHATGFEEGNAGIGWTYLQAYVLTKQAKYLSMAKKSADWLLKVAIKNSSGGRSWHEDEQPASSNVNANLNNGAAGIGMFLRDLYDVTKEDKYNEAAQGALHWLMATAIHAGKDIYWQDTDAGKTYAKDPSWHWGTAGIIAFTTRMLSSNTDIPGEQSGLTKRV